MHEGNDLQRLAETHLVAEEAAAGAGLAKELVVGGDLSRLQPMQRLSLVLVQLCRQASGLLSERSRVVGFCAGPKRLKKCVGREAASGGVVGARREERVVRGLGERSDGRGG